MQSFEGETGGKTQPPLSYFNKKFSLEDQSPCKQIFSIICNLQQRDYLLSTMSISQRQLGT